MSAKAYSKEELKEYSEGLNWPKELQEYNGYFVPEEVGKVIDRFLATIKARDEEIERLVRESRMHNAELMAVNGFLNQYKAELAEATGLLEESATMLSAAYLIAESKLLQEAKEKMFDVNSRIRDFIKTQEAKT
jgi:hypothetical protein